MQSLSSSTRGCVAALSPHEEAAAAPCADESGWRRPPQVRPSPTQYKREFLEKKGMTPAEITEAFRRAPEPVGTDVAAAAPPVPAPQQPFVAQAAPAPVQQVQEPLRWTQARPNAASVCFPPGIDAPCPSKKGGNILPYSSSRWFSGSACSSQSA